MNRNGAFTGNINVPGQNPWTVTLNLDLSGGNDIGGTISDGTWTANLTGNKAVFNASKAPAPQAGHYTMIFAGTNGSVTLPGGYSYATASISKAGVVALAGSLADGSKITQSATLSQNGEWPLYISLYGGKGCLSGWMSLDDSGNVSGNVVWINPGGSSSYYPGGFTFPTTASGGSYAASDASSSFNFTQVVFSRGALAASITNDINIGSHEKVINLSSNKLTMTFNSSTGILQGSVVNPAAPGSKAIPFSGVLLQTQTNALGYFLDANQSGAVTLGTP